MDLYVVVTGKLAGCMFYGREVEGLIYDEITVGRTFDPAEVVKIQKRGVI